MARRRKQVYASAPQLRWLGDEQGEPGGVAAAVGFALSRMQPKLRLQKTVFVQGLGIGLLARRVERPQKFFWRQRAARGASRPRIG
jgi:hypothetical protein